MTILVTGAAGFIGHHVAARLLGRGEQVLGIDNVNDYYSVKLKRDRIAEQRSRHDNAFSFVEVDFADMAALDRALEGRGVRPDRPSRRPGRRSLLDRKSPRLRPFQPRRPSQPARARAPARLVAPRLRLLLVGLRRQRQPALPGRGPGRPSALALRRDQEGRRADERDLRPSLPAAADRPSLLHRLRPVGPARHGDVAVHQGDPRRRADRRLRRRQYAPRLHLYRRHRHRRRRRARQPAAGRRRGEGRRQPRARTGSTISATTGPRS